VAQADEGAEARRQNSDLDERVQLLEDENQLLRESSEGLKVQLARGGAGQQSEAACLQETITAGGSKVKEDLRNVQRDVAKLKEDMIVTRWMTGKVLFEPSIRTGKLRLSDRGETREICDIPDGIIPHVAKACRGNVHDHKGVAVTSSRTLDDKDPMFAVKNATDLETGFIFCSAYRNRSEDIQHTRNNWVCYDFKERKILPTHCTIRTNGFGPGLVGGAGLSAGVVVMLLVLLLVWVRAVNI
jgi:hypothetical protein